MALFIGKAIPNNKMVLPFSLSGKKIYTTKTTTCLGFTIIIIIILTYFF